MSEPVHLHDDGGEVGVREEILEGVVLQSYVPCNVLKGGMCESACCIHGTLLCFLISYLRTKSYFRDVEASDFKIKK